MKLLEFSKRFGREEDCIQYLKDCRDDLRHGARKEGEVWGRGDMRGADENEYRQLAIVKM